jgi:hypothetical protein
MARPERVCAVTRATSHVAASLGSVISYQFAVGVAERTVPSLSITVTRATSSTARPETCAGWPWRLESGSLRVMSMPCSVEGDGSAQPPAMPAVQQTAPLWIQANALPWPRACRCL